MAFWKRQNCDVQDRSMVRTEDQNREWPRFLVIPVGMENGLIELESSLTF